MRKYFGKKGDLITAVIEVKFDYKKEDNIVHNRVTHDEENRPIFWHQVVGTFSDGTIYRSDDFSNKNDVFLYIEDVEKLVVKTLVSAKKPKEKTLEDKLRDKGFN